MADTEPIYQLITTLLDSEQYPAAELAALYHVRWCIETTFAELKTTLKGADIVLRSKTPELVRQECVAPKTEFQYRQHYNIEALGIKYCGVRR